MIRLSLLRQQNCNSEAGIWIYRKKQQNTVAQIKFIDASRDESTKVMLKKLNNQTCVGPILKRVNGTLSIVN